jgi:hypothetical protein
LTGLVVSLTPFAEKLFICGGEHGRFNLERQLVKLSGESERHLPINTKRVSPLSKPPDGAEAG